MTSHWEFLVVGHEAPRLLRTAGVQRVKLTHYRIFGSSRIHEFYWENIEWRSSNDLKCRISRTPRAVFLWIQTEFKKPRNTRNKWKIVTPQSSEIIQSCGKERSALSGQLSAISFRKKTLIFQAESWSIYLRIRLPLSWSVTNFYYFVCWSVTQKWIHFRSLLRFANNFHWKSNKNWWGRFEENAVKSLSKSIEIDLLRTWIAIPLEVLKLSLVRIIFYEFLYSRKKQSAIFPLRSRGSPLSTSPQHQLLQYSDELQTLPHGTSLAGFPLRNSAVSFISVNLGILCKTG